MPGLRKAEVRASGWVGVTPCTMRGRARWEPWLCGSEADPSSVPCKCLSSSWEQALPSGRLELGLDLSPPDWPVTGHGLHPRRHWRSWPIFSCPQTGLQGGGWWAQAGDLGPAGPPCGPSQPPGNQPAPGSGTPAAKSPNTRRLEGARGRDEGTSTPRKDRKRGWRPGGKHQASG